MEKLAAFNVGCLVTTDANGKNSCRGLFACVSDIVEDPNVEYQTYSLDLSNPSLGKFSGVVSERDYVTKIALLGKTVSNALLALRIHHYVFATFFSLNHFLS